MPDLNVETIGIAVMILVIGVLIGIFGICLAIAAGKVRVVIDKETTDD